jgi:DNA-binding response OmpR family regulator
MCDLIAEALRHAGYHVRTAENGLQALFTLEAERPAIVILDLRMPVMDGWQLAEELRTWDVTIPVLLISGANSDVGTIAQQIGARDFLAKPFDLQDLLQKVDRLIASDSE